MNRAQLESLVWKHTHRDFKGKGGDGSRRVLRLVEGLGTCSVLLSGLTLGELVHELPSRERAKHRLVFWRLVVGADYHRVVLGVFGSALHEEQRVCREKVIAKTGVIPLLMLWAGKRPEVGDVITLSAETIETEETVAS